MNQQGQRGWSKSAVLGLTLLAFGLRVYDLAVQSLWVDEAYSIRLAGGDVGAILAALAASDVHPPLHYLALHFWLGLAGSSEFAARYLSLMFSVVSVPLLFALGRRLFGFSVALVAVALLAVSPFAVAYAQEARMYAMVAAWCLGSLYFFAVLASDGAPARSWWGAWIGYVLCTTLAIYTQYYAALVVLFQNAFLLLDWLVSPGLRRDNAEGRRAGSIGPWIAAQASVAILFLPWLPIFLGPLGWWGNSWAAAPGVADVLQRSWQTLNVGMAVDDRQVVPALAGMALLFLLGLAAAGPSGLRRDARWLLFAFLGVAIPAAVLLAISQARSIFNPKFLLMELPLYLLALAYGVSAIARRGRQAGLLAAAVVTV
ncbi:MAG: glycosyltransferase family 39 protein, partial [Chloroflexota bacterium]|nr:glycosyltransferase family 39 protein [Chloroflexota bacterium]